MNIEELEKYVNNNTEESVSLEFKKSDILEGADRKQITKPISAFANSNGGIVIFGIEEDGNGRAQALDQGSTRDTEWLDQIIQHQIQPRLKNTKIKCFRYRSKNYFKVNVPQSYTAHQASDKIYYKRTNKRSIPMEDYEIRDVMNRQSFPILDPKFSSKNYGSSSTHFGLNVSLVNKGNVMANNFSLRLKIESSILAKAEGFIGEHQKRIEGNKIVLIYRNSSDRDTPILFPEDDYLITDGNKYFIWIRKNKRALGEKIDWKIFADNAKPREGKITIKSIVP